MGVTSPSLPFPENVFLPSGFVFENGGTTNSKEDIGGTNQIKQEHNLQGNGNNILQTELTCTVFPTSFVVLQHTTWKHLGSGCEIQPAKEMETNYNIQTMSCTTFPTPLFGSNLVFFWKHLGSGCKIQPTLNMETRYNIPKLSCNLFPISFFWVSNTLFIESSWVWMRNTTY